jgi:hypothetical protein
MSHFNEGFGRFVSEGDSITGSFEGFTIKATVYCDDCSDPPWERDCGHGPVSDWTKRDKKPGERVLIEDRHGNKRFYDVQEAMKIALADGWGTSSGQLPSESKRQYAARAVEWDFHILKAWCDDEWYYCGVAVTISKNGVQLMQQYDHALWGIEANYPDSDNSYLLEVADEQVGEALEAAREKLKNLCDCEE